MPRAIHMFADGVDHLPSEIGEFCDFLDANRYVIQKVDNWHLRIATGPVGTWPEIEATAHRLAWRFAHRMWLGIHNLLFARWILRPEGAPESDASGSFQLDEKSIRQYRKEIRALLREETPADYWSIRAQLRIERAKAAALPRRKTRGADAVTDESFNAAMDTAEQCLLKGNHLIWLAKDMGALFQKFKSMTKQDDAAEPAVPSATKRSNAPKGATAPVAFSGGKMVFFEDRVELCDVAICAGERSKTARLVLDALKERQSGRFVAYPGGKLAAKVSLKGGKDSIGGTIRDLRRKISEALKEQANIECGEDDVILSRGPGYRLSHLLTVQLADATTDHGHDMPHQPVDVCKSDVRNDGDVRKRRVRNVRKDAAPDVRNDSAPARHAWILVQLKAGIGLRAPDVVQQFGCSLKTAQRDFQTLRDQIEFVGAPSTGTYRLKK